MFIFLVGYKASEVIGYQYRKNASSFDLLSYQWSWTHR
jgi:hypothetical protein